MFIFNLQRYFKANSKVWRQLFLGVAGELGKGERRREVRGSPDLLAGGRKVLLGGAANKGPSGRRKGKDEQGSAVVLKCFGSSGVLTPRIAVP